MELEFIKPAKLRAYQNNARTHTAEQIKQIKASIEQFGFNNPVLVDADGEIIAGHGRLLAAVELELSEVPVVRLPHLDANQRRAFALADNRIALNAGWDEAMLAQELESLVGADFDITGLGFDTDELGALLGGDQGDLPETETPPVPDDPITQLGEVWLLGRHRMMCGDSTDPVCVKRLMDGATATLIHADPPYGLGKVKQGVINDNIYRADLVKFQLKWWGVYRRHLADNGAAFIWGEAEELWRLWYGGLAASERMTMRNEVVWKKQNVQGIDSPGMRQFVPQTERALFFMLGEQGFNTNTDNYWEGWDSLLNYLKGEADKAGLTASKVKEICGVGMYGHWFTKSQWVFIPEQHYKKLQKACAPHFARAYNAIGDKSASDLKREHGGLRQEFYETRAYFDNNHESGMTDCWEYPSVQGAERHDHATPKPVAMMARAVKSACAEGGLCAEPFGGSGSTLIACEQTDRTCYTMEISPAYCDVIRARWETLTGQTASLESGQ